MLVLVNAPLVAPVSVKSAAVKPVTSALKAKVSAVVVVKLLVPFAANELKVIAVVTGFTTGDDFGSFATILIFEIVDLTNNLVPIVALRTFPFLILEDVTAMALPFVPIFTVIITFDWLCSELFELREIAKDLPAYFVPTLTVIADFPAEVWTTEILGLTTFGAALALSELNKTGTDTRRIERGRESALIFLDFVFNSFTPKLCRLVRLVAQLP